MISLENITKSYGKQELFENISFRLNRRERVGLVGRNGHGKTTLFRIITGEEQPDTGIITVPRGYRIGYVRQHLDFTEDTVLQEGAKGLPKDEQHNEWQVEKILAGLGFSREDMHRHPMEFSGGYQVRLNLAKVLVSEPDLLLLDEPTNYLDITSIRWIERFLINWPHELLLITHDRIFMDKVVTHTLGIHRKKVRKMPGNTEKYYAQIAQDEEIHEKTRLNDERKRKEVELFISRFRAKARLANMVQSRVKTLEKQEQRDKLEAIKTLDFAFQSCPFPAKYMLSADGINFGYEPRTPLISNLSFSIAKHDRICVVGPNGRGKTTLLKLLAGSLQAGSGSFSYNPNVVTGYFEQTNIRNLTETRTVEEEILYSHDHVDNHLARAICGAMMFEEDDALKKIGVLSGGEKSRVLLAKILVTPVNLLLLDEPSNHLDMQSCDALVAALDNFDGAVIMVTHNELFLHALARRLIVFKDNTVSVFEGTYQDFLDRGGWGDEDIQPKAPVKAAATTPETKTTRKELRRRRSEIITERGKKLNPLEKRITAVEHQIEHLEQQLNEHTDALQTASETGDGTRIEELSRAMHTCRESVDALYEELDELTTRFEEERAVFERRLEELDRIDTQ